MATIHLRYLGDLRTEAVHVASGANITNDAPIDNHGKGENFSPTDTVCMALASCMMITMGIVAERESIDLRALRAEVTKVMTPSPRRIAEVHVRFYVEGSLDLSKEQLEKMERIAHRCPVALSLHPEIIQKITFDF